MSFHEMQPNTTVFVWDDCKWRLERERALSPPKKNKKKLTN